jgi:hypothetical protein
MSVLYASGINAPTNGLSLSGNLTQTSKPMGAWYLNTPATTGNFVTIPYSNWTQVSSKGGLTMTSNSSANATLNFPLAGTYHISWVINLTTAATMYNQFNFSDGRQFNTSMAAPTVAGSCTNMMSSFLVVLPANASMTLGINSPGTMSTGTNCTLIAMLCN